MKHSLAFIRSACEITLTPLEPLSNPNTARWAESGRPGRKLVAVSPSRSTDTVPLRWHCWHTSSWRSVESHSGLTMVTSTESGASGFDVRASTCRLPGPWHCSHPMPSARRAYLPSAKGTASLVPL